MADRESTFASQQVSTIIHDFFIFIFLQVGWVSKQTEIQTKKYGAYGNDVAGHGRFSSSRLSDGLLKISFLWADFFGK